MFLKICVLKNLANFTGKYLCWSLFLIELQAHQKDTPAQVFSCEICQIFNNVFSYRTPPVSTSVGVDMQVTDYLFTLEAYFKSVIRI